MHRVRGNTGRSTGDVLAPDFPSPLSDEFINEGPFAGTAAIQSPSFPYNLPSASHPQAPIGLDRYQQSVTLPKLQTPAKTGRQDESSAVAQLHLISRLIVGHGPYSTTQLLTSHNDGSGLGT